MKVTQLHETKSHCMEIVWHEGEEAVQYVRDSFDVWYEWSEGKEAYELLPHDWVYTKELEDIFQNEIAGM